VSLIEVKTRTARDLTPAEVAVDSHKRSTLRRLARQYARQLPLDAARRSASMCSACILCRDRRKSSSTSKVLSAGARSRTTNGAERVARHPAALYRLDPRANMTKLVML